MGQDDGRRPVCACTKPGVLGLDASALRRIILAGTLEAGVLGGARNGKAHRVEPPMEHSGYERQAHAELIDRLTSELARVQATNRALRLELERAHDQASAVLVVAVFGCSLVLLGIGLIATVGGVLDIVYRSMP